MAHNANVTEELQFIEDDDDEMEKLEIELDDSFEWPTVHPCIGGNQLAETKTLPDLIENETRHYKMPREPKIPSPYNSPDKIETVEIPSTSTSLPVAKIDGMVKKCAEPIRRRSARLSCKEIQPVDEKPQCRSETEYEMQKRMANCFVVLNKLDDKYQHISRVRLRRSLRHTRRDYHKDDVYDKACQLAVRKTQAKEITRVPRAKTPQPAKRITRARSTCASDKKQDIAELKKELQKLVAMELDEELESAMEMFAETVKTLKTLHLRPRSMVTEPMNIEEQQEDTVPRSVHVSPKKPRLTRKIKKRFMEDRDDEAKPCGKSFRATARDTHIMLPQPNQRITQSMAGRLAEKSQTAPRFPKRRSSMYATSAMYS